jgi:hypothetical protein
MKEKSRIKKYTYNLLIIFISTLVALIVCEIIIRLFFPQGDVTKWFKSDPIYGYTNKKNYYQEYQYRRHGFVMYVKTNSMGHRYEEYNRSVFNNPDVKKVMLIGDSFTFGSGINMKDHFGVKLERMLKSDGEFLIINSGVGGWGTLQATSYAKDNFSVFEPDIIVYTFCGNDPNDDIKFTHKLSDNEKGAIYFPGKIWLRNHSQLYRFLWRKFRISLHNFLLKKRISEQPNNAQGILLIQATSPWNIDIQDHLKQISNGKNLYYVDLYDASILLPEKQRHTKHDGHWSPKMHLISANELYKTIQRINSLN